MEGDDLIPVDETFTSLPVDESLAIFSPFEEARKRIHLALRDVRQNDIPLQRFPCTIFHGCLLSSLSEADIKTVQTLFLQLCSMQDQRRWSSKMDIHLEASEHKEVSVPDQERKFTI